MKKSKKTRQEENKEKNQMERKKQNERAVKFKRDPHVFVKGIKVLSPDTFEERSSCERRVQSLTLNCGARNEIHTRPREQKLN